MKTIGIIGGITWFSTLEYYKLLNELVNRELGGVSSAKIILHSLNFAEIKAMTESGDWNGILDLITDAAQKLEAAGAGCLLLGANTMHKLADDVQKTIGIPLLHIATETAKAINKDGLKTIALLGTKYTMQLPFYSDKLSAAGIRTIVPDQDDIDYINTTIYNELGKGIFLPETKARFLSIIGKLAQQGAEGAILGCTEIPLLLQQNDTPVKLYDTTLVHSLAAVSFALSKTIDS